MQIISHHAKKVNPNIAILSSNDDNNNNNIDFLNIHHYLIYQRPAGRDRTSCCLGRT